MAFYWEGNDPADEGKITYSQLHADVCKFANVLKAKGISKGDRVAMYMPMTFELVVAMLACARIGAVHSIVFGGYRWAREKLGSRCFRSTNWGSAQKVGLLSDCRIW